MTERESDDLYDALRDRLADYGQEPPAPRWAAIRAQLPPPVAAPQLRARVRRRQAARLALLLLLLSIGTWGGWQLAHTGNAPSSRLAHRAPHANAAASAASAGSEANASAASAGPGVRQEDAIAKREAARSIIDAQPESSTAASAATVSATQKRGITALPVPQVARTGPNQLATATTGIQATYATKAEESKRSRTVTLAAGASSLSHTTALVRGRKESASMYAMARSTRARFSASKTQATTGISSLSSSQPAGTRTGEDGTSSNIGAKRLSASSPDPSNRPLGATLQSVASTTGASGNLGAGSASAPASALQGRKLLEAAVEQANTVATAMANSLPTTSTEEATAALSERRVSLASMTWPAPTVKASADTTPLRQTALFRRWIIQAVAGPALTHRYLGNQQLYASAPPPNTAFDRSMTSTYSATREVPAAGVGAEVQVRRQLTGRWGFGAGLGYKVYATAQTVTITTWRRTTYTQQNIRPDSMVVSTTHPRDTYRFLTVPLRLSYQLGAGSPRWRYGLLAGAELAIYLGGTTAEGGSRKQWGSSGSPYRALNLALSLGAEVRYRLAPRWELLAQPNATIFLNSLARPASGYVVRYPVAAGGLVGVAYGLR